MICGNMDYFYCAVDKISAASLLIDGEEFVHLVHVMRKKEGDEVRVVDGKGTAYDVRLGEIKHKMVHAAIHRVHRRHHEPARDIVLAVGILKNPSKFDFLVEKVTELGVNRIIPLVTERTIPRRAKVDRWQKLALAAMKQCGRSYLPLVDRLTEFTEFLSGPLACDLKLIAHEKANRTISVDQLHDKRHRSIALIIGPEGGFAEKEVQLALEHGYTAVNLGERRLRTETAATVLSALSLILSSE